jgi:hypothetical protein
MKIKGIITFFVLLIILLTGCVEKIKEPVWLLKEEYEIELSEDFALDFMTYVSCSIDTYNIYIKDFEEFKKEKTMEEYSMQHTIEKWNEEINMNDTEQKLFKNMKEINENNQLIKNNTLDEDELEVVCLSSKMIIEYFCTYFENE